MYVKLENILHWLMITLIVTQFTSNIMGIKFTCHRVYFTNYAQVCSFINNFDTRLDCFNKYISNIVHIYVFET